MASEHSITVLHVSDMQFGKNHRFTRQDSLYASLTDDLKDVQGSEQIGRASCRERVYVLV